MTVYVDDLHNTVPTRTWPYTMSAHLLADDVDELHAFAQRLGLRREWFQAQSSPHYDISASKHKLALELGATRIDKYELVALVRRLRQNITLKGT